MARRLFPVNDAWTDEARRANNEFSVSLADLLAALEKNGPVDLKDFHYLVSNAVGVFVAELSISRRLGSPAAPPRDSIRHYPRLTDQEPDSAKLLPELMEGYDDNH